MTVCPNFEDLAEFVFARKIDGAYFQRAALINAHICKCPHCAEQYDKLLSVKESADAMARLKRRGTSVRNGRTVRGVEDR